MKKGIYLQGTVAPKDPQADPVDEAVLRQALAGTHDGLNVEIKRMRPANGAMQMEPVGEMPNARSGCRGRCVTAATRRMSSTRSSA